MIIEIKKIFVKLKIAWKFEDVLLNNKWTGNKLRRKLIFS
jgi:hypothetical protein